MDFNLYQQSDVEKRVVLDFGDYVFTPAEITENLAQEKSVNPQGDLAIGVASMAKLTFEIMDNDRNIPEEILAKSEFTYKAGINTATESKLALYRKIKKPLVCIGENEVYAGSPTAPYLTIWSLSGEALPVPEAPQLPVKSLILVDGTLYCGHDESPYLSVYGASGTSLVKQEPPALNPYQISKILRYNKRSASFSMAGNTQKEYELITRTTLQGGIAATEVKDLREKVFEYAQIGRYISEHPVRKNDTLISVEAYDFMSKSEVAVDDWNEGLHYPITAAEMLASLCSRLQIELATTEFLNGDYLIQKNYHGSEVLGRDVIQWVAQLAACFADMDERGRLRIRWYTELDLTIDQRLYTEVTAADYEAAPVDKLQIRVTENDIGVITPNDPAKTNALIIENNPLLYAETDAELRPAAESILAAIDSFAYVPYKVKSYFGIPQSLAGYIIFITTQKGRSFKAVIMNDKTTGAASVRSEYSATGGKTRETKSDAVNRSIQQLRGSVHEMVTNIKELSSTITSYQYDTNKKLGEIDTSLDVAQSSIDQNATAIEAKVSQTVYNQNMEIVNESITALKLSTEGLDLAVNSGHLTFTENGLTTQTKSGSTEYKISLENGQQTFYINGNQAFKILPLAPVGANDDYIVDMQGKIAQLEVGILTYNNLIWRTVRGDYSIFPTSIIDKTGDVHVVLAVSNFA